MKEQNILIKFISVIRLLWWRLNAILGWIILLPIDYMITLTTEQGYRSASSDKFLEEFKKYKMNYPAVAGSKGYKSREIKYERTSEITSK